MSGHSKWATIKHKKAATDAKRGRAFTKVIREITIAARVGGGDPDSNPRLRSAILAGKNENMPNENIERAIQRGTGQIEGEQYEEVNFEGYGPGGVGMILQVVTTNRNRVVSEIRHMMSRHGGNLAETGAVGWMFSRKGQIIVPKEQASEDKMLSIVLDAGGDDLRDDGSEWEVLTPPEAFEAVREALSKAGITPASAEVAFVPQNYVQLTGTPASQMCSGSSKCSMNTTTCSMCTPTSISTRRNWPSCPRIAERCPLRLSPRRQEKLSRQMFSQRRTLSAVPLSTPTTARSLCVLGVDPAVAGATGYGVVESDGRRCRMLRFGALRPASRRGNGESLSAQTHLRDIHALVAELIREFAPDGVAIESVFTALNMKTALRLAEVRGVILLAAAQAGVASFSYSPREVKATVAGYGNAGKEQVQQMVRARSSV